MHCICHRMRPLHVITPRACARGKVIEFVFLSFFLSVTKKKHLILCSAGQLEFIGRVGSCMMRLLFGILNQMYHGFKFLLDTLESRLSIEWCIDTFGPYMLELYSQLSNKTVT